MYCCLHIISLLLYSEWKEFYTWLWLRTVKAKSCGVEGSLFALHIVLICKIRALKQQSFSYPGNPFCIPLNWQSNPCNRRYFEKQRQKDVASNFSRNFKEIVLTLQDLVATGIILSLLAEKNKLNPRPTTSRQHRCWLPQDYWYFTARDLRT